MTTRLSIALVLLWAAISVTAAQPADRIEVVLPRDAIPAIDAPEFEPADRAARLMDDNDRL